MMDSMESVPSDLLDYIEETLDNYADCEVLSESGYHPNQAMSALTQLQRWREKQNAKAS